MNEKLIEQQQQQIKNLSDEITLMRMKYEGIGSIFNRQHLQSQLDKANEKANRWKELFYLLKSDHELLENDQTNDWMVKARELGVDV